MTQEGRKMAREQDGDQVMGEKFRGDGGRPQGEREPACPQSEVVRR